MKKRLIALFLCIAMCMGMGSMLSGCGGKTDAFVIMTEQLDGLFNPFFYTSAPDGTIVSMTQIGMLGSKYVDGEVQVAYAIGVAKPVSVLVDTFGTATVDAAKIAEAVNKYVDLRPAAIIKKFDLRKPIYSELAAYGHMGREDLGVSWEKTDLAETLKAELLK